MSVSNPLSHAVTLGDVIVWNADSSSRPEIKHTIAVNLVSGDYSCSCEAHTFRVQPRHESQGTHPNIFSDPEEELCVHAKAARALLRQMGKLPYRKPTPSVEAKLEGFSGGKTSAEEFPAAKTVKNGFPLRSAAQIAGGMFDITKR